MKCQIAPYSAPGRPSYRILILSISIYAESNLVIVAYGSLADAEKFCNLANMQLSTHKLVLLVLSRL